MSKLRVAIPLKTNSSRVAMKNIRPFTGDKSLFDIKAEQLLKTFDPKDVYVSSENMEVKPLVERYGFNFLERDMALTSNSAHNALTKDVISKMPKDGDIMWVQVTQPLFNEFSQVVEVWKNKKKDHDSLAIVQRLRHHILDSNFRPVNFNFGYWHKVTQELPPYYQLTWAGFIMKRQMLEECGYHIGRNPYLYETHMPLIDIDTEQEFETASVLYDHYKSRSFRDGHVTVTGKSVSSAKKTQRADTSKSK